MKEAKFDGMNYIPKGVAGMSEEAFVNQMKKHVYVNDPQQMQKLKDWHAEATRLNNESISGINSTMPGAVKKDK